MDEAHGLRVLQVALHRVEPIGLRWQELGDGHLRDLFVRGLQLRRTRPAIDVVG